MVNEEDPIEHDPTDEAPSIDIFRVGVILEAGLALVAAVVGWMVGFNPTATIELTRDALPGHAQAAGWGVAATLPLVLLMWLLDRYPVGPLKGFNRMVEEQVTPLFFNLTTEQMALLSIAAGMGEETLFRGLLQAGLADWIGSPRGVWIALAVASVVFGLCHFLTTTYFVLTTVIGVYLGALFLWTDSLLAPLVTHALYDFLALNYLVRGRGKKSGSGT